MTAKITRRRFFSRTARAASVAVPVIVPAVALGRAGWIAPSERIVLGSGYFFSGSLASDKLAGVQDFL